MLLLSALPDMCLSLPAPGLGKVGKVLHGMPTCCPPCPDVCPAPPNYCLLPACLAPPQDRKHERTVKALLHDMPSLLAERLGRDLGGLQERTGVIADDLELANQQLSTLLGAGPGAGGGVSTHCGVRHSGPPRNCLHSGHHMQVCNTHFRIISDRPP